MFYIHEFLFSPLSNLQVVSHGTIAVRLRTGLLIFHKILVNLFSNNSYVFGNVCQFIEPCFTNLKWHIYICIFDLMNRFMVGPMRVLQGCNISFFNTQCLFQHYCSIISLLKSWTTLEEETLLRLALKVDQLYLGYIHRWRHVKRGRRVTQIHKT